MTHPLFIRNFLGWPPLCPKLIEMTPPPPRKKRERERIKKNWKMTNWVLGGSNPPNEKPVTQKLIAKHVFKCFKIRNKKREGRQKVDQMCVCICNYHYICNKYTWEFVMYKYVITWKIVALNHLENSWCTRWYEIQIINIVLVLSNKVRGPGACFPGKIRTFWMSGTLVFDILKSCLCHYKCCHCKIWRNFSVTPL